MCCLSLSLICPRNHATRIIPGPREIASLIKLRRCFFTEWSSLLRQLVTRINVNRNGDMVFVFLHVYQAIGDHNHSIANSYSARRRSVQTKDTRAALTFNDVSLQPRTIADVDNLDAFVLEELCRIHQVFIDGDTAYIIQVRLSDSNAMKFGFIDRNQHKRGESKLILKRP